MTNEQRLEKLERELLRAKRQNRWLLVWAILTLALIVVWVWSTHKPGSETALSQDAGAGLNIIRANAFILEDRNSKPIAKLFTDKGGSGLILCNESGKPRVGLGILNDGPSVGLYDENDKLRVILTAGKTGPGLALYDENGEVCWSAP